MLSRTQQKRQRRQERQARRKEKMLATVGNTSEWRVPLDVWEFVIQYMDTQSVFSLGATCQDLRAIVGGLLFARTEWKELVHFPHEMYNTLRRAQADKEHHFLLDYIELDFTNLHKIYMDGFGIVTEKNKKRRQPCAKCCGDQKLKLTFIYHGEYYDLLSCRVCFILGRPLFKPCKN